MKTNVERITPSQAKIYLLKNRKNRRTRANLVNYYAQQMKAGLWKENGEPIIFDINGDLKDGQHRLEALVKANYTCEMIVVNDVLPNVMDTIDTGQNRGLNDILELNNFKNPNTLAALVKRIIRYDSGMYSQSGSSHTPYFTNSVGLTFASDNNGKLQDMIAKVLPIYKDEKVISQTDLAFYLYVINDFRNIGDLHIDFIKLLAGQIKKEGNGVGYLHRILRDAKQNKTKLNRKWIIGMVIKTWNLFVDGDPPVTRVRYDHINQELPKPKRL